jgi:PLP dependent protein
VFDPSALRARLDSVRLRIANAAGRAGRDASSVRLVAVSKTFPAECIRAAAAAGQVDFGENKVQEGLRKMAELQDLPLRWHLIGHLQSNKAKKAGEQFDVIHSVDSQPLLDSLDRVASQARRTIEILVQVDLAGETTKHGVDPRSLLPIFEAAGRCASARVVGLMLLPPATERPEQVRPYFRTLRQVRDDLIGHGIPNTALRELSMGMSHDFEIAVEEGATMVRVGSAIFGARTSP